MRKNTEHQKSKYKTNIEVIKWTIVVVLLIIATFGQFFYREILPIDISVLIVVILVSAASIIALLTKKGKKTISFICEARNEIRKIIWPTPQETLHTTLIVAAVTAIMSLTLWGLDDVLVRLISLITEMRL